MSTQTIHGTTNYKQFHFVHANRPVSAARVEKLIKKIRKKNLLAHFPILCRRENGKLVVYDGQHRLYAAEKLGVKIFYTINGSLEWKDIPELQPNSQWAPKNFLESYADQGNVHYSRLKAFVDKTNIPLSVAVSLMAGGTNFAGCCHSGFKDGAFKCGDIAHAEHVAALIGIFRPWIRWATDRSFVLALSYIARATKLDSNRLSKRLVHQSISLVKCANWLQYIEIIDRIYNYKVKGSEIVGLSDAVRKWVATKEKN